MKEIKNALKSILRLLGILSLFVIANQTFRAIINRTETKIISERGLKTLQDPKKAKELRAVIDSYHENGSWQETKLEKIL